jgi:hypothetical protein
MPAFASEIDLVLEEGAVVDEGQAQSRAGERGVADGG